MFSKSAYVAGFGTAGALLASCAAVFVVASAFVGFHGWPSASRPSSAVRLTVGAGPAGASGLATSSTRRLRALTASRAARPAFAPGTGRVRASVRAAGSSSPSAASGPRPAGRTGPGSGTHTGPPILNRPAPRPPTTCTRGCAGGGGPPRGGVPGVVGKVLQTAGSTVSHAGGSLGGAVQQVTGHVPGPGGVVSTSGAAAGGAITGTAGTAGKLLGGG